MFRSLEKSEILLQKAHVDIVCRRSTVYLTVKFAPKP
jgi:hypothetical protein